PICNARTLLASLGLWTQVSAATRQAARDCGTSLRKERTVPHPHHTASRRGSRCAQNAAASSNLWFADKFLKKMIAGSSVGVTVDLRANSGKVSNTDRAVVNRI